MTKKQKKILDDWISARCNQHDISNVYTVSANYDFNKDYERDELGYSKLKDNSIPRSYTVNGKEFKTIEELVMYISVAFANEAKFQICYLPKNDEQKFISLMQKL